MTTTEAITEAQRQLGDVGGTRWPATVLLVYLNEGRKKLRGEFPDAFCVTRIVTGPITDLAADITLDISNDWTESLVSYMCGKAMMEDSEDAANMAKAQYWLKRTGWTL